VTAEQARPRGRIIAAVTRTRPIALLLALALVPNVGWAKGLAPDDAAAKRSAIVDAQPSDPRRAIDELTRAGEELGDPELFLLAARLGHDEAEQSRDLELAQAAAVHAAVARDIGLYLADKRNYDATDWRPVTHDRASDLAREAARLISQSEALADQIEAERLAAAEAARARAAEVDDEGRQKRERRPGTGLIAGGSAALVLGVAGVGMLGTGLALGSARQRDAEALNLPAERDRLTELDAQGASANTLAYVGGAFAGVGLAVGVALIVVGVKKRNAAGPGDAAGLGRNRMLVGGWVEHSGGGFALQGRF
jgi:hypothetical protein